MNIKAIIAALLTAAFVYVAGAQTTSDNWQAKAIAKYPELGVRGTDFNTRFIAAYNEKRKTDPKFFADPRWPLVLGDEVAEATSPLRQNAVAESTGSLRQTAPAPSQFTWPTADQIGQTVITVVFVIILLVLLAVSVVIARNWKTSRILLFHLYRLFFR